jgi:two-component system nitrate/nitrite response regulator NarL
MTDQAKVRLLLVDDHGLFREGLSRLLADEPDLELAAQCSSVDEVRRALARVPANAIDLMLLDFDLGERTGFDALEAARALGFAGKVLMVTAGMGASETARALNAGASGIFLKHSPPAELLQAIRQVVLGQPWPDRATVARLLTGARQDARQARSPQPLTPRERDVLRGVFEGRANKEIAAALQISEGSVKAVLQQLFAKTGVRSRAQLVRIALENRYEYQIETG